MHKKKDKIRTRRSSLANSTPLAWPWEVLSYSPPFLQTWRCPFLLWCVGKLHTISSLFKSTPLSFAEDPPLFLFSPVFWDVAVHSSDGLHVFQDCHFLTPCNEGLLHCKVEPMLRLQLAPLFTKNYFASPSLFSALSTILSRVKLLLIMPLIIIVGITNSHISVYQIWCIATNPMLTFQLDVLLTMLLANLKLAIFTQNKTNDQKTYLNLLLRNQKLPVKNTLILMKHLGIPSVM